MAKPRLIMVLTHDIIRPQYLDVRVYNEAISLIQNDFDVTVICRVNYSDKYNVNEIYDGINIIRVPGKPSSKHLPRVFQLINNYRQSKKIATKIKSLKPDIIHCHDLDALLEGVIAARKLKVPLIYDSHEDWPLMEHAKGFPAMYYLTTIYEKILLDQVSHIITVNRTLENKFTKFGKTTVLFNYPSISFFNNLAELNEIRKKYELDGKTVVMYHGIIGVKKGINELIDVAVKTIERHKKLIFIIIGPGHEPYIDIVKSKGIEKSFILTGPIDYSEIPSYLKLADIYYSVFEPIKQYVKSTPIKIFEAMALGLPVIANAEFPELKQIVEKNQAGILVKYKKDEILKALENLINESRKRKQMGKNAEETAKHKYIWEAQEPKLIGVYNELLKAT